VTETIATNGATILTMIVLWSTVTWAATYMYMSRQVTELNKYIDWMKFEYGDVIDQWIEHRYDDERTENYAEYEMNENGSWYRVN
jgi:hypothetical protein